MFEELLAEVENELGPTHARTLGFRRHLIGCLTDLGEYARAEALLDDVVSRVRGTQGDKSIWMALIQSTRGRLISAGTVRPRPNAGCGRRSTSTWP